MKIDIITIFPDLFPPYLNESLLKRAQKKKLLDFHVQDLRDFTEDRHHKVDDRPYGGGPGMILKIEPFAAALQYIAGDTKSHPKSQNVIPSKVEGSRWPILRTERAKSKYAKRVGVIALDPSGKQLTQKIAKRLASYDQLVLLAGRYEGYDARLFQFVDERISIGPYVLAGGELPALVLIDTVTRQIPGVLGDPESLKEETHSVDGYVEYPQYSRPTVIAVKQKNNKTKKLAVPKVLLSGNHAKIAQWRRKHAHSLLSC